MTWRRFLWQGAAVVAGLAAFAGLGVYLTARSDDRTARALCTSAAGARFAAPVTVDSADRTDDDTYLVHGTAPAGPFTCRVTRNPLTDGWELAGVA